MAMTDITFVRGFIHMANEGYLRGWHERNGGNLSYRAKPDEVSQVRDYMAPREWAPIGTCVPDL